MSLWPHQRSGAAWLVARLYGFFYWEMGAGKTAAVEADV